MRPSQLYLAAALLLLAEACFAGIGAIVKFTSATATEAQVVFFRNFFALLLMLQMPLMGLSFCVTLLL